MKVDLIKNFGRLGNRRYLVGKTAELSSKIFRTVLIIGISFIILYPILTLLSNSFMSNDDMLDPSVKWIPRHFTLQHFQVAMNILNYIPALFRSLSITLFLSLVEVTVSILVGYGLARFKFPGHRMLFVLVILTLIVPPSILSVPLFLNFRYFDLFGLLRVPINLIGSVWPMFFMALTGVAKRNGLFIYLAMQFFRGMSISLEEAAYIDGSGILKTFFRIILPNSTSILIVSFLFAFVWMWNDLFYSTFFLKGMDLLVLNLQSFHDRMNSAWATMFIQDSHIALISSAGSLLFILPILVIYVFLQRYFVESIEKTGLVG